jgi:hypothetical protein
MERYQFGVKLLTCEDGRFRSMATPKGDPPCDCSLHLLGLLFWIMGADSTTFGFKFIIQFHQNNIFELTTQCIKLIRTKLFWCRISIKLHECMKQQSPWSPMEAEKLG